MPRKKKDPSAFEGNEVQRLYRTVCNAIQALADPQALITMDALQEKGASYSDLVALEDVARDLQAKLRGMAAAIQLSKSVRERESNMRAEIERLRGGEDGGGESKPAPAAVPKTRGRPQTRGLTQAPAAQVAA